MRKSAIILAVCILAAACWNQNKKPAVVETIEPALDTLVYEGIVPSADGPGIRYTLRLVSDTTFVLTETYLEAEDGKDLTYEYSGKTSEVSRTVDGNLISGICLPLNNDGGLYFVQINDSTLRMVGKELEEAVTGAGDYDLRLVK